MEGGVSKGKVIGYRTPLSARQTSVVTTTFYSNDSLSFIYTLVFPSRAGRLLLSDKDLEGSTHSLVVPLTVVTSES